MNVAIQEDPERRLAERQDRVLKRLRAGGTAAPPTAVASSLAAPSPAEGPLHISPPVEFIEFVESTKQQLQTLQAAFQGRFHGAAPDLALVDQLTAAAEQAEAEADMMNELISTVSMFKDPRKVQASMEGAQREAAAARAAADGLRAQAAAAHEKCSAELETLFKRQTQEMHELAVAVAVSVQATTDAMSAAAAAAANGLLRQLAARQASRRVEIELKIQEYKVTEANLRAKRTARLEEHRCGLAASARRDHAAYDTLAAQLPQQVIQQSLQLGAAKREAILAPEALNYNCRVLEERTRENRGVLAELKHSANSLEAMLAGLRAEHTLRGGIAAEEAARALTEAHRADEALQTLLQKNRHFERTDAAELQQLVALKEDSFAALGLRLSEALETVKELGGMDLTAVGESGEASGDAAANHMSEAYWRSRAAQLAPAELVRRLQELEAAVRADLQAT